MHLNRRNAMLTITGLAGTQILRSASVHAASRTPERIRIGQIGVGHAHASKLSVYRNSQDYEVVGIVESDPELRREAIKQSVFQDLTWMTEEQLLNVAGLDVVLVETRVRDSLKTAAKCIAAGKHVHLDKPAGASLADYQHLLENAAAQGLMVQMGYMYRYNPAIRLLREFLDNRWLGEVFEAHAVMSKVVSPMDRAPLAEFTGGIMFELGCHIIDLVVAVLGAPVQIGAHVKQVIGNDGLNDNMLAVFDYPHATATVKTTALEIEGFSRRHLVVCGTEGTFHIQPLDNPSASIALAKPHDKYRAGYQEVKFPKFERYVADAADMAQVIRGQSESSFSYAHDLAVQEAVLRASGML